jgi:hypothetical protein
MAALYVLVPKLLDRAAVLIPGVSARVTGFFAPGGDLPLSRGVALDGARPDGFPRPGAPAAGGPFWSSWEGANGNRGELVLGPFPAPRVLGLPVAGYPRVEGNRLYLENTTSSQRMELTEGNIGGAWSDLRLQLPASWENQPVLLHALDASTGYFGWLAVGAPRRVPIDVAGWNPFARKLHGFIGAGLLLLLLQSAAMTFLRGRPEIPAPLRPLAAFAAVALVGYVLFWVFFAWPLAGKVLVWAVLAASAWRVAGRGLRADPETSAADSTLPLCLMAAVGALYLGLVALYGADRSLSDLGAHRFIENLVYDNEVPHLFADRLIHGEDPRHLIFGWWSSSDRPPLQAACDLLVAYPLAVAGVAFETAGQAAGLWLQLVWVCAAWGWLRAVGASFRQAALVTAALAPSGFFVLNSVFVWPKLLAGAFVLGAFTLWLARADPRDEARRSGAWGILATLGFLAHAGAVFSLLAWLPLASARIRWRRLAAWLPAAAALAVLVVPWIAYQSLYNPPANFLLKLHLGGARVADNRGTWETIASAYRSHDPGTLLGYRLANLRTLFAGPWGDWLTFNGADLAARRNAEYYGLFYALGWWNLGFLAIGARLLVRWRRGPGPGDPGIALSLGWCFLTLAVWLAMMFLPVSTVIHQGSYACVLLLFLCLGWTLCRHYPRMFTLAAALQAASFIQVWLPPNPDRVTPLHWDAAVIAVLGAAAVVAVLAKAPRGGPQNPAGMPQPNPSRQV